MQLKFTRSKSEKGMMKKVWHFELKALLHVTPAERTSLERYNLLDEKVTNLAGLGSSDSDPCYLMLRGTTTGQLLAGQGYSDTNLSAMLEVEEAIKEACVMAYSYCYRGDSFDGDQRVFEVKGTGTEEVEHA